jgi:DNA modification methylase
MCGDSTSVDAVDKLMLGQKADLNFTSPPYNANTKVGDGDIFTSKKAKKLYAEGYSDNLKSSEYVDFASGVLNVCFSVTDGFIFWNVSYNANSRFEYIQQIVPRLPYLIEQICWKKSSTIPFKGSLMRDWEPIYLFSTHGEMLGLNEVVSNFWQISNTNSQAENHKACFPVELPEKGISIVKKKTGIVFEPFGGSGSTLIACEKTKRQARLMELDPKYCDVIVKRWQDFTGKKATLESSGEPFDELAS